MIDDVRELPILQPEAGASGAPPQDPERHAISEEEVRELRAELSAVRGEAYWRRLEELAPTAAFQSFLRRWFPSQAGRFGPQLGRRDFLRTMGSSLALAGLGSCTRQPEERIYPFATSPEYLIPGKPRYFATSFPREGGALGVLVESHMGRPTKVEGNPEHPASQGATDAFAQAEILSLYDPDRTHSILRAGQISTWDAFLEEVGGRLEGLRAMQGRGLAVLVADTGSPTLRAQLEALLEALPRMRVHHWKPLHRDHARRAARSTFGREVDVRYRFDAARVVVSLDADFLAQGPSAVRDARGFAAARRQRVAGDAGAASMNRLYAVESSVSLTGAMADHRVALGPADLEGFARLLGKELGLEVQAPDLGPELARRAAVMARDLRAHAGASIVIAAPWQSPVTQELAHRMNHVLGNVGRTLDYAEAPAVGDPLANDSIVDLVAAIQRGDVETLVMLGGNPAYDAPVDLDFKGALQTVPMRVHLSQHVDETSRLCQWHVPMAHALESWSDALAFDGTASIVQPLIAPLHGGKTAHELVAVLADQPGAKPYDLVRAHWKGVLGEDGFEERWERALHDGLLAGTRAPAATVRPLRELALDAHQTAEGLELVFRPDAATLDGRYANNGWLQELPRPLSRLTWDNAILLSRATADELGVESGDLLEVESGERRIEGPVWVAPGHADGCLTLHLGYGREQAGGLGSGVGFDAYRLRRARRPWSTDGASARPVGGTHAFATVQEHGSQEGRELARVATFDRFTKDPQHVFGDHAGHDVSELSMYPGFEYTGYSWGMVIDLNACIGCTACMAACQSENNVPVVGKEEVARGREMHWIRIDRYFDEEGTAPVVHQPIPCMHCENAPCEVVCPVGATTHSDEGLNEMTYNRCVGTRYCSNNCPYKVRHFNFFAYADYETESLKLANNPDVTVRTRGVMEKCTYCVQRINYARIDAKKDGRRIADGEVVTACQQVCPTQAITFGDINDANSRVSAERKEPHHYGLLDETLNTRPRTTYLAKLTNPNPDWEVL